VFCKIAEQMFLFSAQRMHVFCKCTDYIQNIFCDTLENDCADVLTLIFHTADYQVARWALLGADEKSPNFKLAWQWHCQARKCPCYRILSEPCCNDFVWYAAQLEIQLQV